ncbi:MAG: sigma factor G inhibitor Gin [Clostridium sp.]|nr:sigma factor G inhibitor Gin [Clostridium sp.]
MSRECIICRKPLDDGIMLYGQRICKGCEERLLTLQYDTDFYEFYKNCIRKNVVQFVPRGVNNDCQDYR